MKKEYKEKISTYLQTFLQQKQQEATIINHWGSDVCDKLISFSTSGKMIRGSLVLFMYEAYNEEISEEAIKTAMALELFHSALLIHDDIMDNDETRRGHQTVFAQYKQLATANKFQNDHHFGESMGICVGDIAFFSGFQLLASINNQKASDLCMKEMTAVGLAQMQDVYSGYTTETVSTKDIEQVYLYKTARYTFSLPMMMGALLADEKETEIEALEKLGEAMGLIFQYTDDTLSLFGKPAETGKPEGSDIRENKKTLYRHYLFEKASVEEKNKLATVFGNQKITNSDLSFVRELIKTYNIGKMIEEKIENLQKQAKDHIIQLQINDEYKETLLDLLNQLTDRKK